MTLILIWKRRPSARIVATVFASLSLVGLLLGGALEGLFATAIVCGVIGAVLLWLPPSTPWFRRAAPYPMTLPRPGNDWIRQPRDQQYRPPHFGPYGRE